MQSQKHKEEDEPNEGMEPRVKGVGVDAPPPPPPSGLFLSAPKLGEQIKLLLFKVGNCDNSLRDGYL